MRPAEVVNQVTNAAATAAKKTATKKTATKKTTAKSSAKAKVDASSEEVPWDDAS